MKQIILLLLVILSSLYAEEYADFLITGNLGDCSILNKYEQPVTDAEKAQFTPFSPLQVVDRYDTLGDGISVALKFLFMKKVFFFPLDEAGNPLCGTKKPVVQTFSKCQLAGDTIRIVRDNAVFLSEKYPPAGRGLPLKKNDMVYRVFRYNAYYYVLTGARYGWCQAPDGSAWKKDEAPRKKEDPRVKADLLSRIAAKVEAVNETYVEYFDFFNSVTQQEKSTPRWVINLEEDRMHCFLATPYKNSDQLQESTRYLVKEIENMLLGKPFVVSGENGEIYVKPKE